MKIPICISAFSATSTKAPKTAPPTISGPSWAMYGQAAGVTEMTDWRLVEKPAVSESTSPAKSQKFEHTD